MLAKTIAEIMITMNATMMTKHPKSVRRATMRRSISHVRSVRPAKGYVTVWRHRASAVRHPRRVPESSLSAQ